MYKLLNYKIYLCILFYFFKLQQSRCWFEFLFSYTEYWNKTFKNNVFYLKLDFFRSKN